eukprot:EG_transcript_10084
MGNSNGMFVELTAGQSGPGRYHPGETVHGVAHLNLQAELKNVKGVMLKVSGVETANWREKLVVTTAALAPRRMVAAAFNGNADTILRAQQHDHFKATVPLMQPDAEGKLAAGQYSVPFSFTLPAECPPSFYTEGRHWICGVEYKVKAVCKLAGMKSSVKYTQRFDVTGVMPAQPAPLAIHDAKKVPRFGISGTAGQLKMDFNLDRNVWFAGDRLECTGSIANESKKPIGNIKFRVERVIEIHRGYGHTVKTDVAESSYPGLAANEGSHNLQMALTLPSDLIPTCHGRAFHLKYLLTVDCDISWVKDPKVETEIVVCAQTGTAPSPQPAPPVPAKWEPEMLPPVVVPALVCSP